MSNVSEEILIKEVHSGVEIKEESVRNTPVRYLIKACVSGLIIFLGYLAYFCLATKTIISHRKANKHHTNCPYINWNKNH